MKRTVEVTFSIEVEVDESKFTPEFIDAFKKHFHDLDSIEEHIEYIAELHAKNRLDSFTEGYGELSSMGIKAQINDVFAEVEGEE